jgi:hypothetical protein
MATTTNFGWETPDDTDYVKDGAAAMRTLGNSIDTSFVDLKGGTSGQILSKASNTDLDYTWVDANPGDITGVTAGTGISGGGTSGTVTITNSMATAIDAKGDLIAGTGADAFSRLAVGTNGYVLTADSAESTGMKWAAAAGGSTFAGCSLYRSAGGSQAISNATNTNLAFDAELYDTDGFHDTSTNNDRITIPSGKAGKYLITAAAGWPANATGERSMRLMKNGSTSDNNNRVWNGFGSSNGNTVMVISRVVNASVGDYFTLRVYQSSGGTLDIYAGSGLEGWLHFDATYLGA